MKKLVLALSIATVGIIFAGCQGTDVVGKVAVTSFEAVLKDSGQEIASDEANNGWSLSSPNGERFVWTKDSGSEGTPDLMMEFDAAPFLAAGLDPSKLDPETYLFDSVGNVLMVHAEKGDAAYKYSGDPTPISSFEQFVKNYRDSVGYHETLDHYGAGFGNGNMFEWAKDTATNDKDIVFVLNPQPLQDAGLDPAAVEGWAFAKVEIKNDKGEAELVDKLLKPYNLK